MFIWDMYGETVAPAFTCFVHINTGPPHNSVASQDIVLFIRHVFAVNLCIHSR